MAKLTDHQVMAIREEYAKGNITQQMLAEKFGINRRTVSKIINRQRWAHI
jgi:plasmid maintenance system antidote protein VapI